VEEVTERSWAHIERVRADIAVREGLLAFTELNATLEQRVEERTTALAQAEAALRQSQKLEAIGQLTGGVAHDFNNLLTIIRSSVDFLRQPGLAEERRERYMTAVSDTVERASKLTSQLLAFARRQPLKPEVFDVSQRVRNIGEMLESVTGARIQVRVELPERPCHVRVDSSQFETALINIALNARDAMDGQGTLTLRVATVAALPRIRGDAESQQPFVTIALADTGSGMSGDTFERIFEPFFTTKAIGKGTGLGLSQVFGFAKQSGGNVDVASTLGHGTVFTLYLPEVAPQATQYEHRRPASDSRRRAVPHLDRGRQPGSGPLRQPDPPGSGLPDHLGHRCRTGAGSGRAGWHGVRRNFLGCADAGDHRRGHGQATAPAPADLPVVLTSGYSEELADSGYEGFEFLAKPYSAEQVARALARAMLKD
jgi:signal transduction histidine kinase